MTFFVTQLNHWNLAVNVPVDGGRSSMSYLSAAPNSSMSGEERVGPVSAHRADRPAPPGRVAGVAERPAVVGDQLGHLDA